DELDGVAVIGDPVPARGADRLERIVIDLAAGDGRQQRIEERDERAGDPGLRLTALAQEDDVLAGEDRVLDLGDDRLLVADDAVEQRGLARERDHEVGPKLLLHGPAPISALAERPDAHRAFVDHACSPSIMWLTGARAATTSSCRGAWHYGAFRVSGGTRR